MRPKALVLVPGLALVLGLVPGLVLVPVLMLMLMPGRPQVRVLARTCSLPYVSIGNRAI